MAAPSDEGRRVPRSKKNNTSAAARAMMQNNQNAMLLTAALMAIWFLGAQYLFFCQPPQSMPPPNLNVCAEGEECPAIITDGVFSETVEIKLATMIQILVAVYFGVCFVFNFGWLAMTYGPSKPDGKWCLTLIICCIMGTSATSYTLIAAGYGKHILSSAGRPVESLMYLEWFCTTPLFIILVCQLTGRSVPHGREMLKHVTVDILMIASGFVATIAPHPWKPVLFMAGCMFHGRVMATIYNLFREAQAQTVLPQDEGLIRLLEAFTYMSWGVFPAVWLADNLEILSIDASLAAYAIVDVFSKAVYTVVMMQGTFLTMSHLEEVLDMANEEVLANLKDLTRRMGLATALVDALSAQADAESTNKLQRSFIANISHELRTPLNAVIAFTTMVLDIEENPEAEGYLRCSLTAAEALLGVINQILEYSRFEAGVDIKLHNEIFCLKDVCAEVQDITSARGVDAKVELVVMSDDLSMMEECLIGDTFNLRQVLVNLCDNAIKFSPEDSICELRLMRDHSRDTPERMGLRMEMRDQGIGIPPDKASMLFRPFSQVSSSNKRLYPGTGLGLVIVKRIVNLMGGDVFLSQGSEAVRGATFVIQLSLYRASTAPTDALESLSNDAWVIAKQMVSSRGSLAGLRCIVALPDNASRLAITRHLEYWGCTLESSFAATALATNLARLGTLPADDVAARDAGMRRIRLILDGMCADDPYTRQRMAVLLTYTAARDLVAAGIRFGPETFNARNLVVLVNLADKRAFNQYVHGDTHADDPLISVMNRSITKPVKADSLHHSLKVVLDEQRAAGGGAGGSGGGGEGGGGGGQAADHAYMPPPDPKVGRSGSRRSSRSDTEGGGSQAGVAAAAAAAAAAPVSALNLGNISIHMGLRSRSLERSVSLERSAMSQHGQGSVKHVHGGVGGGQAAAPHAGGSGSVVGGQTAAPAPRAGTFGGVGGVQAAAPHVGSAGGEGAGEGPEAPLSFPEAAEAVAGTTGLTADQYAASDFYGVTVSGDGVNASQRRRTSRDFNSGPTPSSRKRRPSERSEPSLHVAKAARPGEGAAGARAGPGGQQRKACGSAADKTEFRGLRCLVVEDNPINQQVAVAMTRGMGLTVELAANGQIALDMMAAAGSPFDVVLMDVQMPVLNGYEATIEIRKREKAGTLGGGKRVPIIAMTANASANDRAECLTVGMDDYMCKPVYPQVLREKIRSYVAHLVESREAGM